MTSKIFLKDYKKPDYQIDHVQLFFELSEDVTFVESKLDIRKVGSGPLILDGVDLQLVSIQLNEKTLNEKDFQFTETTLTLPEPSEKSFTLKTKVRLQPSTNTSLEGLYQSQNILCTQCEAQGFRKVSYFIDRPDVMSRYTVRIEADEKKYPILLSNGNRIKSGKLGDGKHFVEYVDPSKKPCYLFALVAGDLGLLKDTYTTSSGRKVDLEVYSRHGTQDQCRHALQALKDSMAWDEKRYGLEYDLDNYMIVAVDDFNAGAMENKGLNVFNSKLVFADEKVATDDDYFHIESVVGHEYFHNWTGNRVTLRDWFQLSLKEGLTVFRDQEFSGDQTDRSLQRLRDVESLWKRQFPEDNGPSAHPVRPESCMAVDNFFTPTIYEKGAEVIRMLQTILGRPLFAEGLKTYLTKNDGKAATIEDFVAAFEEVSKKDLSQIMSWYTQAGTPTLIIKENFDPVQKKYSVRFEQKLIHMGVEKDFKPYFYPVDVCFFNQQGSPLSFQHKDLIVNSEGQSLVLIHEKTHEMTIENVSEKPVSSWLRNYSAPVFIKEEKSVQDELLLLKNESDFFQKRQIFQKFLVQNVKSIATEKPKSFQKDFLHFCELVGEILNSKNMSLAQKSMLIAPLEDQMFLIHLPKTKLSTLQKAIRLTLELLHEAWAPILAPACKGLLAQADPSLQIKTANLSQDLQKPEDVRAFLNSAWFYLSAKPDQNFKEQIFSLFQKTQNMTLADSTFKYLIQFEEPMREKAIALFYDRYSGNQLTLNKWFSNLALNQSPMTTVTVKKLTTHPAFNFKNPNNVYALIRNFGQNLFAFHGGSDETYDFYLDQIKIIDKANPQVAARLCSAFQVLSQLEDEHMTRVKRKISAFLQSNELSKNTTELLKNYESLN